MNYYEELGIRPDADEEEIRKAHRRLVKLMHPDQHRDAGLKALAETQMRRLNSIVATLLDPEERREYDEQLRGGGGDPLSPVPQQGNWKAVPWWIASTLGAIILTVGTLWFLADRMGPQRKGGPPDISVEQPEHPIKTSTQPPPAQVAPTPKDEITTVQVPNTAKSVDPKPAQVTPPAPPPPPLPAVKQAPPQETAVVKHEPPPAEHKPPTQVAVEHKPAPAVADHKPAISDQHQQQAKVNNAPAVVKPPANTHPALPPQPAQPVVAKDEKPQVPQNPPAAQPAKSPDNRDNKEVLMAGNTSAPSSGQPNGVAVMPSPDVPRVVDRTPSQPTSVTRRNHNDPLEGEWVYAPAEPEKRKPGLYPPEFIELKLVKDSNGMHGEYSARYNVDRPVVSPDVNFVVKATDETAMKYEWTAADGAHGWMQIRDLETDTMRLEWKVTSKNHGDKLTSGKATLVRKN